MAKLKYTRELEIRREQNEALYADAFSQSNRGKKKRAIFAYVGACL